MVACHLNKYPTCLVVARFVYSIGREENARPTHTHLVEREGIMHSLKVAWLALSFILSLCFRCKKWRKNRNAFDCCSYYYSAVSALLLLRSLWGVWSRMRSGKVKSSSQTLEFDAKSTVSLFYKIPVPAAMIKCLAVE